MNTQTATSEINDRRAVRFFWGLLIGASAVSLIGNVAHAMLPYVSSIVVIQIAAAVVPPIVLLAAVHGIAVAVRAGASGTVYRWAVRAVAIIGIGAFTVSFLALRDLMMAIGYSAETGWIFPAIIDTAVAVSTMMLVALGDKPVRRSRTAATTGIASTNLARPRALPSEKEAKPQDKQRQAPGDPARAMQVPPARPAPQADEDLATELIASGATTQPLDIVIAVLAAHRDGESINAAAKASGINFRAAQRITWAARGHLHQELGEAG